jgi:diguanylate cyclase
MSIAVQPGPRSFPAAQSQRPNFPVKSLAKSRPRACIDWLLAGIHPEPDDIRNALLHQRASKTRTLAVAIFASLLIATIAAALTEAPWAYAWLAAELVLGSIRIYLMMKDIAKAKAAQRTGTTIAPIWAGLASMMLISAGCFQCVRSGESYSPKLVTAGIGKAAYRGGA